MRMWKRFIFVSIPKRTLFPFLRCLRPVSFNRPLSIYTMPSSKKSHQKESHAEDFVENNQKESHAEDSLATNGHDEEQDAHEPSEHRVDEAKTDEKENVEAKEGQRQLRSAVRSKDPTDQDLHDQPHRTVKRTKSDDTEPSSDTPKKKRRSVIDKPDTKFHEVANEANRGIVEMLNDMAGKHFLLGEKQQGIACETAAKSMRETEKVIQSGEAAEHFRGVGDHVSRYIEEFLETGKVKHLEDLHHRADEANVA